MDIKTANGSTSKASIWSDDLLGDILILPECPENLISQSKLIDENWFVKYYPAPDDHFQVSKDNVMIKFDRSNSNLYQSTTIRLLDKRPHRPQTQVIPPDRTMIQALSVHTTAGEHRQLSESDINNRFVQLHERLGHPSNQYLLKMIKSKVIECDITEEQARKAIQNLEECNVCTESKITKFPSRSTSHPNLLAKNPGENLHVDIMFYRRKMFLVAVDEYCGYCSTVNINAKDSITVWNALIKIRSRIMSFNPNFKIKKIKSDRDSAFNAIEDKLGELGIRLHRSEADGHDGMIERYIRSIKQVARSIEISISYTIHPDMIVPLIEHASQCLNLTTNNKLLDNGSNPWFVMSGERINFDQQLRVQFGEILIFLESYPNKNGSHEPRGKWGIVLGTDLNSSGVISVKLITTGRIVTRKHFKRMGGQPPKGIMDLLHAEGMKTELHYKDDDASDEDYSSNNDPDILSNENDEQIKNVEIAVVENNASNQEKDTQLQPNDNESIINDNVDDSMTSDQSYNASESHVPTTIKNHQKSDEVIEGQDRHATSNKAQESNTNTNENQSRQIDSSDNDPNNMNTPNVSISILGNKTQDQDPGTNKSKGSSIIRNNTIITRQRAAHLRNMQYPESESKSPIVENITEINKTRLEVQPIAPTSQNINHNISDDVQSRNMALTHLQPRVVTRNQLKISPKSSFLADEIQDHQPLDSLKSPYTYALLSLKEAKLRYPNKYDEVFNDELHQFIDQEVFDPIEPSDLRGESIIHALVLFNVKINGKLKCRIVANGRNQNKSDYLPWEISGSTASTASILAVLSACVLRDIPVSSVDIKGAYLNAEIKKKVIVKFNNECSDRLIKMRPELARYKTHDGYLYGRLNKALYGLAESAQLWQTHFTNTLKDLGYHPLVTDPCVLKHESTQDMIVIYVDDALICVKTQEERDRIHNFLEKRYNKIKIETPGSNFIYRGIEIKQNQKENIIELSQEGYINQLLSDNEDIVAGCPTPADQNLFKINSNSRFLNEKETKQFLSDISRLAWLASQCRPDIKIPTSFLASRVTVAREEDIKKMKRVFSYLFQTKHLKLKLTKEGGDQVNAFVDASYMTHDSCHGQNGILVRVGNNFVTGESKKQPLLAQSSTESEFLALNAGVNHVIKIRELMQELGFQQATSIVYQDNMSTIALAHKSGVSSKMKHMKLRELHVKQNIDNNIIKLTYCPTEHMVADILTKPTQGSTFTSLRDRMMNNTT